MILKETKLLEVLEQQTESASKSSATRFNLPYRELSRPLLGYYGAINEYDKTHHHYSIFDDEPELDD